MPCIQAGNAIITLSPPLTKLRCRDGRHVWVCDREYLGPDVFHDRRGDRLHEEWYDDAPVAEAVTWWYRRGMIG